MSRIAGHRELATLAVVLDAVRHEVQQHLLEPLRVGPDVLSVKRCAGGQELDAASGRERPS